MTLEIQFNKSIIKKVKSLHFQVDQLGSILFILFCLYEGKLDLLDEFDDYNRQRRALILYKELEMRGLIVQTEGDFIKGKEVPLYNLTKDGIALVEYIQSEFNKMDEEVTSETIAVSGVEQLKLAITDDVEAWIDEWLDIFPAKVRSGGKLVKSDRIGCIRKMRVFMREWKFDKDTILKATKRYVSNKEQEGWSYMRCAVYFIYRVEGSNKESDLAAECEQILQESTETPKENNLDILA